MALRYFAGCFVVDFGLYHRWLGLLPAEALATGGVARSFADLTLSLVVGYIIEFVATVGLSIFCTVLGLRALLPEELGCDRVFALLAEVSHLFLVASPSCSRRAPTTSLLRPTARWLRRKREPAHGSRFPRGVGTQQNGDPLRRK